MTSSMHVSQPAPQQAGQERRGRCVSDSTSSTSSSPSPYARAAFAQASLSSVEAAIASPMPNRAPSRKWIAVIALVSALFGCGPDEDVEALDRMLAARRAQSESAREAYSEDLLERVAGAESRGHAAWPEGLPFPAGGDIVAGGADRGTVRTLTVELGGTAMEVAESWVREAEAAGFVRGRFDESGRGSVQIRLTKAGRRISAVAIPTARGTLLQVVEAAAEGAARETGDDAAGADATAEDAEVSAAATAGPDDEGEAAAPSVPPTTPGEPGGPRPPRQVAKRTPNRNPVAVFFP